MREVTEPSLLEARHQYVPLHREGGGSRRKSYLSSSLCPLTARRKKRWPAGSRTRWEEGEEGAVRT